MPRDYLTSEEAAKSFGVSVDFFEEIAAEFADWLKPTLLGLGKRKVKRWPKEGVAAMQYILDNRPIPGGASREKSGGESTAEGG